jgi:hypothetical protein
MLWRRNRHRAPSLLFEHDLFGKPLHTFPDHALDFTSREDHLPVGARTWSPAKSWRESAS